MKTDIFYSPRLLNEVGVGRGQSAKANWSPTLFRPLGALATVFALFVAAGCSSTSEKPSLTRSDRARLYVEIANTMIQEGDAISALENLLKAEQEDDSLPEIYHSKSLAFIAKRDTDRALGAAQQAVKLKPDYADANSTLGKLLIDAGNLDDAIKPLKSAADNPLYREAFKPLTSLGVIYYRKREFKLANQYLDRAIAEGRDTACVARFYRGNIRMTRNEFGPAEADYKAATAKACGGFAEAHLGVALAYLKQNKVEEGRRKLLEVHERFSGTNVATQALAELKKLP